MRVSGKAEPSAAALAMGTSRELAVRLHERRLRVRLSAAAVRALAGRDTPLVVELELYFSCLIRKQVRFRTDAVGPDAVAVEPGLYVRFCPVMSTRCEVDPAGAPPPLTALPIVNPGAYVPRWLHIDYRKGAWQGEFGFV